MNGILLVTHKDIGNALIECVTHVYGVCPDCIQFCAVQGGNEEAKKRVQAIIQRMRERYDSILILTDIYGASPSNVATQCVEPGKIAALAGVNVPMLLRAICYREEPLESLCQKALEGGARGMVCTTTPLEQGA